MKHRLLQIPLLRSATLLTLVNIVNTGLAMLSGLYVARQLDTQQYGHYAYMANVFLLMILFLGFGLSSQISKDAAEHDGQHLARFQERLGSLIALRLGTALLAAVCGGLLWSVSRESVYLYAGGSAALFVWVDFVTALFSGLQRIRRVAILMIVQPLSFILLLLAIPIRQEATVYTIFLSSQIVSAAMACALVIKLPKLQPWPRFAQIRHLRWSDMVAGQVYIIVLLQTAYSAYGVTVLGALKQYDAAGELSIALTVVRMLPLLFGSLITVLYYPRLCAIHTQGEHQRFQRAAYVVYHSSTVIAAGCAALLVIYPDVVINVLYTSRHAAATPVLGIIALMSLFSIVDQILTWTLVASDRASAALPPLLVRLGLVLLTLPLAALVDRALLPQIVALAYIGSSFVGWIVQLRASSVIGVVRAIGFTTVVVGLGCVIGLAVRFVIPWPALPYGDESSLVVAALCYGMLGVYGLWKRWHAAHGLLGEEA
ncbi:MAG TPA: lipopolysaccharide biosynthesis protein [Herpetosiphonaceae bacterium]